MPADSMLSSRPYLLRALYEWILDSDCTPHIVVQADAPGVDVPRQYVKDGQIVLNISPLSVMNLLIDKQAVSFNARFGGVPMDIYVPVYAIAGIYARENGRGMMFEIEPVPPTPESPAPVPTSTSGKPTLRVVK